MRSWDYPYSLGKKVNFVQNIIYHECQLCLSHIVIWANCTRNIPCDFATTHTHVFIYSDSWFSILSSFLFYFHFHFHFIHLYSITKRNMLQFIRFDGVYLSICHSIGTFIYSFLQALSFSSNVSLLIAPPYHRLLQSQAHFIQFKTAYKCMPLGRLLHCFCIHR